MIGLTIAIIVTFFVARLIFKSYLPQAALLAGGVILLCCAILLGTGTILSEKATTGFIWFDIFRFIKNTLSSRAGGLGLTIMAVAGFAKYMDNIGASKALVHIIIKPLQKLKSPYIVLALGYIVGQLLNMFIPSATGLGVLLMVTLYPVLISLGVSPLSATAMIGTSACLDLGPASGNSILAAKTAEIDVSVYFAQYQLPVAIATMITITILHFFVQRWFDKRDGFKPDTELYIDGKSDNKNEKLPPSIYALLPIIPFVIILSFSKLMHSDIKMDVVTAMLISMFISIMFELIRSRDLKNVCSSLTTIFDGMGSTFAKVVTLIVAGGIFAGGLKQIGAISTIINAAQESGFSTTVMIIIMTLIIAISAILMGSGNAPFFAFAALAPDVAAKISISPIIMLLPMQLAAGIARSMSPITAAIIAVSGISNVSPVDVVKRTAIPMAGALFVSMVMNFILF